MEDINVITSALNMTNKEPAQVVYHHQQNEWGTSKSYARIATISIIIKILQGVISFLVGILIPKPEIYLSTEKQDQKQQKKRRENLSVKETKQERSLFPSISNLNVDSSDNTNTKLCSTGLTTRLLPFKNANGEIEWAFTDDIPAGNELDIFKMNPKPQIMNPNDVPQQKESVGQVNLTPVSSNSSNNESIISNEVKHKQKKEDTPMTNPYSPFSSSDERRSDKESEKEGTTEPDNDENGSEVHQCPHCNSAFKIRGYLTRHLKKHALKKAYTCPFHKFSIYIDENNITHKCHPNGGFSRRDTYKTHLKSRHFKYPKGTKTKDRPHSAGSCSMCGEFFENSEIWCEIHIEGGECRYLPVGFKGKSRIKNRLKKQMSKQQRKELEANEYGTPFLDTPNSIATPMVQSNNTAYDYNSSNSPTFSVSSSIAGNNYASNRTGTPMSNHSPPSNFHMAHNPMVPQFDQFQAHNTNPAQYIPKGDDYDDDYCLDTDQLNFPTVTSYGDALNFVKYQNNSRVFDPLRH